MFVLSKTFALRKGKTHNTKKVSFVYTRGNTRRGRRLSGVPLASQEEKAL